MLPRNTEWLYSCQIGIMMAGGAHVCIDTSWPDSRIRHVLEDADIATLLTDAPGVARASAANFPIPFIIDASSEIPPCGDAPPAPPWLGPGSLAYVIYTSGTTGKPKGVMIEHGSIANLVHSDLDEFELRETERVAQGSSPAYDSSVEETWLALGTGATLVVIDEQAARLGPDLIDWLRHERITVLCPPPTLLRSTGCERPAQALPDLKLLYVGGEALPEDIASRWGHRRRLVNGYGPTECSVTCVRGDVTPPSPIAIGKAVRGMAAHVLDAAMKPVPDGERGELCMSGIGLARGYRGAPDLTSERFPHHPDLGRIYRTGDLVHRDAASGNHFYHGRIDTQVKLRGFRIELGAVESVLLQCKGVGQAACCVHGEGGRQLLCAYVVPSATTPPDFAKLRTTIAGALPDYMIPARWSVLEHLPTTTGGKLDRNALPAPSSGDFDARPHVAPVTERECIVAESMQKILALPEPVSTGRDFFTDLGGDSLAAALLVTHLRSNDLTMSVTVRDIYENPTVSQLALVLERSEPEQSGPDEPPPTTARCGSLAATCIQSVVLLVVLALASEIAYLTVFKLLPGLVELIGLIGFTILLPPASMVLTLIMTPLTVLVAVTTKRLLIGRYTACSHPVWGGFYIRNWIVARSVRLIPWGLIQGTVFQLAALRALGARIGKRVDIHPGVDLLQGAWDLLTIGDDVTLCQDAQVRLVHLEDGQIVVGPVSIGARSTLDIRAGLDSHTEVGEDAFLGPLSSLPAPGEIPAGEHWEGIPAGCVGPVASAPTKTGPGMIPGLHGVLTLLCRLAKGLFLALPFQILFIIGILLMSLDHRLVTDWLLGTAWAPHSMAAVCAAAITLPLIALATQALAVRLLGPCPVGTVSRWSITSIRIIFKMRLVEQAGEWLSGTLFWPIWLRAAGMKIAHGCEISTISGVIPEHLTIGRETFCADGIYLGSPRFHQGSVTCERTTLGENTFLGNHVVIPAGSRLPSDILLGVCTIADQKRIREGSSWFGQPPFKLPRREIVEADRKLTHNPSAIRYGNRIFWEALRFALPSLSMAVALGSIKILAQAEALHPPAWFLGGIVPALGLGMALFFSLFILGLKWVLLGRVKPGRHPLWSCWCSRWDFLYVAWGHYARGFLSLLEGTKLLQWYLRAVGIRIGKNVVLGNGFAQVVDPDMLHFEDGATVTGLFQAHSFEDRVLKIDHVRIRQGANVLQHSVLLYGAGIGARTRVAPHSVVMKGERLLPGRRYAGCPTSPES